MPTRRSFALVGLPALVVVATATVQLVVAADLPDPVATHFGPDGTADGFASPTALLLLVLGLQVALWGILSGIVAAAGRQVVGGRGIHALPAGTLAFVGALVVASLWPQRGVEDAAGTSLDWTMVGAAVVVAAVVGVAAVLAAPPPVPAPVATAAPPSGAPRTRLDDVDPTWRGSTRVGRALPIVLGTVTAVLLVVTWFAGPLLLPVLVVVVGLLVANLHFTVVVDPDGVAVRGVLGVPRTRVDLDTITQATVEDVRPMAYGGWGWRLASGRTAVLTSAGPGLVVHRTDDTRLVVTLQDPDGAAGHLNALLDRRAHAR